MIATAENTAPAKRRHAFHAFPHRQHPSAICHLCCQELASEFAADELHLLEELTAPEPESEIVPSEALPF